LTLIHSSLPRPYISWIHQYKTDEVANPGRREGGLDFYMMDIFLQTVVAFSYIHNNQTHVRQLQHTYESSCEFCDIEKWTYTDIEIIDIARNSDEKCFIYTILMNMSLNMSVTLYKLILDH
jgi:hypothetical protein